MQRSLQLEYGAQKAQTDIDMAEAQHPNVFVAGWRPFVGWVCGFSLGYTVGQQALILWNALVMTKPRVIRG